MKKIDAIKNLNIAVKSYFINKGFKPYKCEEQIGWLKVNENDLIFIDFAYESLINGKTGRRENYNINPSITISNFKIEDYNKKVNNLYNIDPINFKSVWVKLAVLENSSSDFFTGSHNNYNWELENEFDFKRVADLITDKVEKFAWTCYEKFKTVEQIDKMYNNIDTLNMPLIYISTIPDRAIKGIIAAKLTDNPNLNYLLNYYSVLAPSWNSSHRMKYEELVKEVA